MSEADAVVGRLFGRYRATRRLGAGSMGAVYEGTDTLTGERVAIKILHAFLTSDPSYQERFEQEAHVAALLQSPYTVRLRGYGVVEGSPYLAMDFIDGPSVADVLEREGRLEPRRALGIAADVSRALEEAAVRGVVHRDIKPSNILLTAAGQARLADFGIARRAHSPGMTMAGGYVGTAAYGAPEQQRGEVDHRSDIYALGATLYHMLAGRPPYTGSMLEVLDQHARAPFPAAALSDQADDVVFLIRRCMPKDPADRFQNASELAAAIERTRAALSHDAPAAPSRAQAPAPRLAVGPAPEQLSSNDPRAVAETALEEQRCPSCGGRRAGSAPFCGGCGARLDSQPPMPTRAVTPFPAPTPAGAGVPGQTLPLPGPAAAAFGVPPGRDARPVAPLAAGGAGQGASFGPAAPPPGYRPPMAGGLPTPQPRARGGKDGKLIAIVAASAAGVLGILIAIGAIAASGDGDNDADALLPTATAGNTATSTRSPTVRATNTPAPPTPTTKVGDVVLSNRFEGATGLQSANVGRASVENGQLLLQAPGGPSVTNMTFSVPFQNVTVLVKAYSANDQILVACRHKQANVQYRAAIEQSSQKFSISRWNTEQTMLVPWKIATVIPRDSLMDVRFTCNRTSLTLAVNGTVLATVEDAVLTEGTNVWIGLNGKRQVGEETSGRFDDLIIIRE